LENTVIIEARWPPPQRSGRRVPCPDFSAGLKIPHQNPTELKLLASVAGLRYDCNERAHCELRLALNRSQMAPASMKRAVAKGV